MERVQKEQESRNAASTHQVSQGRFAQLPGQADIASRIDNSPQMIAQRKRLQGMFGGTVQLQAEEEPLQGKFASAATMAHPALQMKDGLSRMPQQDAMVVQRVSEVSYQTQEISLTPKSTKYEAGKVMVAELDKDDQKAGYGPDQGTFSDIMGKAPFHGVSVRGHLLNDHLGGPGEDYNMIPISKQANHDHLLSAENYAKDLLGSSSKNKRLHYEVTATPNSPTNMAADPTVVLDCAWWLGKAKESKNSEKITSKPDGVQGDRSETDGDESMSFRNSELADIGWGAQDDAKKPIKAYPLATDVVNQVGLKRNLKYWQHGKVVRAY